MKKMLCLIWIFVMINTSCIVVNSESKDTNTINNSENINGFDIIDMINQVEKQNIINFLVDFVEFGPKPTGSKACDEAGEYIYNKFNQMGLDVEYHDWKFPLWKGKNIIATQHGKNPVNDAVFIVCAHYDTWHNTTGANDDGSGIAAMLTIAEITSKYNLNNTIKYVAFSGHETWPFYTYGSTAYVTKVYENDDNIIGVLNLDMIGNTSKTGNAVQLYGLTRSNWLLNIIKNINEKYDEFFDIIIESFFSIPGGDEKSFIDYGYDAVLFIQSEYWLPPNHQPEDDITTINFDFLTNLTKLLLTTTVELANNSLEIQIKISRPFEGYIYFNDIPLIKSSDIFYHKPFKLRGATYVIGGEITVKTEIFTDDEIKFVAFILDDVMTYKKVISSSPYEFKIEKHISGLKWLRGRHKIGVQVQTYTGKTAFDEMDLFFLP